MRLVRAWFTRTAVVGLTLTWFGCGGGGVPDPSSDPLAAQEEGGNPLAAAPGAEAPAPAPAATAEADAPAAEAVAVAKPVAPKSAPPAQAAAAATEAPAAVAAEADTTTAAAATPSAKGDASGTNELLNLANNSAAPVAETAKTDETKSSGSGALGGPSMPGGGIAPPGSNSAGIAAAMPPNSGPNGGPPPGIGGIAPPSGSGQPGMPGMPGMPGGSGSGAAGSDDGLGPDLGAGLDPRAPVNYQYPIQSAMAFLRAAQTKNRDLLADATALRAPTEAKTEVMKKLFSTIADQSISDDKLTELATALKGYRITGQNDPKSTGRLGIILGKPGKGGDIYQRTLTLRKEAKGWKVMDIGGEGKLEYIAVPRGNNRGMPRRR